MLSRTVLALAVAMSLAVESYGSDTAIDTITVEAAKTPMSASDIASSITVIDSEKIEKELAQSIHDLVRYEPGVNVVDQGSRFGLSGISIRGIGGNRVKIEVDGVGTSDAFSIGSFSNASRDFVDVDSLKQVEIIRGPASAVFGSDAIGGVVSFITKGPHDFLGESNKHLDMSAGFNSVDASSLLRTTGALRHGNLAAMIRANVRQGEERDIASADPLDDESLNLLTRLEWGEHGNGAIGVSLEHFRADNVTDVDSLERVQDFSAAFGFPFVIDTTEVSGDDRRERTRVSLGQEWLAGKFGTDYLRWRAYVQESETRQDTFEARETLSGGVILPVSRDRSFTFDQGLIGLEINAASDVEIGRTSHQIAYGVEYEETDTEQLRDGTETNLLSGETSKQVGPDLFPVRDFPTSRTRSTGAYVQDSISLGRVTVTPGVRWDRYELDPTADPIFTEDNPGISTASLEEDQVSPKLGMLWRVNDSWTAYAQYSEGFRAPPVNDVNVGFTNFQFGYTTLPNPDLKSESSIGYEVGLRFASEKLSWDFAVFETHYDDFIESFQVVGFDPINQLLQFQSVNVDEVEIKGAEFKGRFILPYLSEQLSLSVTAAYAEGENRISGAPINSIAPLNGVIGLEYEHSDGRWGANLIVRGAARQDDLDETDGELLNPSGFVVYDAFGYWKPSESTRLRAGLYNATDHQHTAYLDVQGVPADSSSIDRFQRPGRHFSVAVDWAF